MRKKKLNPIIEDQSWHPKINDRPLFNLGESQTWKSKEWERKEKKKKKGRLGH
jgi:hypothetical protein